MKRKKVTYTKAEELSIDDGFFTNKADRDTDSENHFNANADKAQDEFLIMGLSKGTIIFVRVDDLESIYARFSVHH